jgi:putative transposase
MSRERRRGMVERDHPRLSICRQCHMLALARSTWYRQRKGEKSTNLALMRLIDAQFLETPFYGSRQMRLHLWHQGIAVGRGRVRRLMRKMGLMAIYQKPRTSVPHPEHKIYPYLLRGLRIDRPNQVWCADITYVPMKRGFLYLVAIMDWHSRAVLAWQLSNTMDVDFCVAALKEAMNRYGVPEIFNTDQGSQFTSLEFTETLKNAGVSISMDGKGRWMDNVFIERLWRSVKWECLYLRELETGSQARQALGNWFHFYNEQRPHSAFDGRWPMDVYRQGQKVPKAA